MDLPTSSAPVPPTAIENPSAIGSSEDVTPGQDVPLKEPLHTNPEPQLEEKESNIRCTCSTGGRNLVVCIDGTSNQFGKNNTNVIELYRLVKKRPDDDQLTYYNSGIGTYAKPSWKSLHYLKQVVDHKIDLAIAWNFETIVLNAYRWLSDKYREGDKIYLFGFSRGAYQVRVLSAMINKVGLIHEGNEEQIPFAYELYASSGSDAEDLGAQQRWRWREGEKKKSAVNAAVSGAGRRADEEKAQAPNPMIDSNKTPPASETPASRFKATFSRDVKIHFVGVWDTVSSVGVVRHKVLPDTANGMKHVCYFRHALALDERRVKFLPEYVYQGLSEFEKTKVRASQSGSSHTKEVWFVGTHSDIGGGNVNNETMDRRAAPLRWMLYEASGPGGLKLDDWSVKQEPTPKIYESLKGIWWLLEVMPIKHLSYGSQYGTRRRSHLGASRCIKDGQTFHSTVLASLENKENRYTPKATISWLPDSGTYWENLRGSNGEAWRIERDLYEVVRDAIKKFEERPQEPQGGEIVSIDDFLKNNLYLDAEEGRRALRENKAVEALLEAAASVLDHLKPEHLDALLDTTIQIATAIGTETVPLTSDCLRLMRLLRERPQWPQLRDLIPMVRTLFVLSGHTEVVPSVSISHDGTRVASGSYDKTVRIWDASTGTAVGSPLDGHSDVVRSVAFSPDGTHVVSGSADRTIRVWNLETGTTVVGPIKGHTDDVNSVAYSSDGLRIVSGSFDGTIQIWDAKTGAAVGEPLRGHQNWVRSVAFSPDGTRIASGGRDRTVRIWDAATGAALGSPLTGHDSLVLSVAFSPDGAHVVSGSWDDTIRVWDVQTGATVVGPITGHTDSVCYVAYSPDGSRIVSGSYDRTIRIWDAKTGKAIRKPLTGHEGRVWSVAFSPDGKRVVSGSLDCTVRIWDVEDLVVE
ncbi:hypothetical protein CERSUDRAFT_100829 [Gelatoporia subvermispora B]|uniref:T6SS Phospholipase effector Tle1-like catalytic domain-containing protein n=1 Tax=Ceriporiopsis subvermispora (strain B) TaxID=914234 RepID=M2P6P8_CERS8|nr:hypothetical protein CERSUDRAFT_100829 [Gelatoporia subvermispora B]